MSARVRSVTRSVCWRIFWGAAAAAPGAAALPDAPGEIYFEGIAAGLVQIAQSSEQLRGGGEMRVRLAVYSSFAVKWLIPRLAGLRQLYPELDLSLEMVAEDPELSDRVADGFITVSPKGRATCTICSIGSG